MNTHRSELDSQPRFVATDSKAPPASQYPVDDYEYEELEYLDEPIVPAPLTSQHLHHDNCGLENPHTTAFSGLTSGQYSTSFSVSMDPVSSSSEDVRL